MEIDKGRGNSIKILNRVLIALGDADVRISHLEGGNKSNAIPREAEALITIPKKKLAEAKKICEAYHAMIRAELASVEPDLQITISEVKKVPKVIKKGQQKKICKTIAGLPHGVIKMSADIAGLVETSTNVAVRRSRGERMFSGRMAPTNTCRYHCPWERSAVGMAKVDLKRPFCTVKDW